MDADEGGLGCEADENQWHELYLMDQHLRRAEEEFAALAQDLRDALNSSMIPKEDHHVGQAALRESTSGDPCLDTSRIKCSSRRGWLTNCRPPASSDASAGCNRQQED